MTRLNLQNPFACGVCGGLVVMMLTAALGAVDGGLLTRAEENTLGRCPIGTILAYSGNPEDLEPNWVVCDGRKINDLRSSFEETPNLSACFLRGKENKQQAFATGGQDQAQITVPAHPHNIDLVVTYKDSKFGLEQGKKKEVWDQNKVVIGSTASSFDAALLKVSGNTSNAGAYSANIPTVPKYAAVTFVIRAW